ncbi:MAG TPA: phospholipase D family protein [Gaiellaceae bacterium]|nr:phospholipase D family protein [Gaiellaceae bacterium]
MEHAVVAHHRRRLRHRGHEATLDAPAGGWASGDPPPRPGSTVDVLVDGAAALPRLADAIAAAESHVHLAGWHFSPDFALRRGDDTSVVRNLLAETAERVPTRVLAWAGPPLPLFRPSRSVVRQMRDALTSGTRVQCALDSRERPMHCHHEKIAVIDDRTAFVGGIDLTSLAGDRLDVSSHPARATVGWHDASVMLRGPAIGDVAEHFAMRWREVTGERLAAPETPAPEEDGIEAQIVRTIPEHVYDAVPEGDFRILESYVRALRGAQHLIYLESQFLWSPELARILINKLRDPPSDRFRLVVLLPAKPNNGNDDTRGVLGELIEADGDAGRFLACTLYARHGRLADPVYVHAKIGIVDDRWLTVGSANLNDHSLFNDTEMNVVVHDAALARQTRLRLWAEHLERPVDEVAGEAADVVDSLWRPIAGEQLERRRHGAPLEHRLVRLPHVSRRTDRLRGPVNGLLVDG